MPHPAGPDVTLSAYLTTVWLWLCCMAPCSAEWHNTVPEIWCECCFRVVYSPL